MGGYYIAKNVSVRGCVAWDIMEKDTGHKIKTELFRDDADALVRRLRKGFGFDGWTPAFFLTEVKNPTESLNEIFARKFSLDIPK